VVGRVRGKENQGGDDQTACLENSHTENVGGQGKKKVGKGGEKTKRGGGGKLTSNTRPVAVGTKKRGKGGLA